VSSAPVNRASQHNWHVAQSTKSVQLSYQVICNSYNASITWLRFFLAELAGSVSSPNIQPGHDRTRIYAA